MLYGRVPINHASKTNDHNCVDKVQHLLNEDHSNVNLRSKLVSN